MGFKLDLLKIVKIYTIGSQEDAVLHTGGINSQ